MVRGRKSARDRVSLAVALAVLAALFPACGVAQGQAATKPAPRTTCSTADYRDDPRLGPKLLPNAGPLAAVLEGYDRFGGMRPGPFLKKYYNFAKATWWYPRHGGFRRLPRRPFKMKRLLFAGQRIDRFGSKFGEYLSPAGEPYRARALPPQNLNSQADPGSCNYSRYRVLKAFPVYSGSITSWFGQPGRGEQYFLDKRICPAILRISTSAISWRTASSKT